MKLPSGGREGNRIYINWWSQTINNCQPTKRANISLVYKFIRMNLQEHIRRILREESISVDMKTVQSDLINMIGPSKIKIVNTIGSLILV